METRSARSYARESQDAARAIRPLLDPTPTRPALGLDRTGALLLKLESFQPTGSFKVRGALHRLGRLTEDERRRGVVAASTGNHGAAVAYAADRLGVRATVIVPESTSDARVAAIEARGAAVERKGAECGESERAARARAERTGETFVSPYNDPLVMAGQGTMALELLEQAPRIGRVYVAVGGGGLIGGIAAVLKDADPSIEVVGCSPEASCAMHASVAAARVVETPHLPTLSLATAGALEEGSVTFEPCAAFVDRWELVSEDEIESALLALLERERLLGEGAAAVALAVRSRDPAPLDDRQDAVIVCGGNLDRVDLERVLRSGASREA
ncbi:MAG: pyridoxal-phosphate dependent enzyme [Planctomycetota bacterium]